MKRSSLAELALMLGVLVGAVLTGYGWFTAAPGSWIVAPQLHLFGWLLTPVLLLCWRFNTLAACLLLAALIGAASNSLGAMLAVLLIAWSATTLGRLLLTRWPTATGIECLGVGLTVYGTLVGLMVQWPINYPGVYLAMLASPLLLSRRFATNCANTLFQRLRECRPDDVWQRLLGGAILTVFGVHLLAALMPEVGHDALATHLYLPARITWGHIWEFDVDRYVWSVMPLLVDWLYTIGYMLAGEAAARLVNFGCILVLGRLIYELTIWIGGNRRGGLLAVLLYASTPLTIAESSTLFIESAWSCLVVTGAMSVFRIASRNHDDPSCDPRHLVIGGTLLGGALAAKAVSMTVLPVLALVLLVSFRRWLRRDQIVPMIAGAGAFVAIGCLPYARAYLLTGNPVFPFFNAYFQSPHYAFENFAPPHHFDRGTSWDVLYRMTFASMRFLEGRPGSAGFQWLLLVLPVALTCLLARHRRSLLTLAVSAAIVWLTFRQTAYLRYVFPSFAMFAATIGASLGGAVPMRLPARALLTIATVATIALNLLVFSSASYTCAVSLTALVSASQRDDYITRRQPLRSAIQLVNELNQEGHPVAFLAPALPTDLHAEAALFSWYNYRFQQRVTAAKTSDELGEVLARERVRYLLLSESWQNESLRQRIRDTSVEIRRIGNISIRQLPDRYRYRHELLSNPSLQNGKDWQASGAVQFQPDAGATVTVAANLTQRVPVVPGHGYQLSATVRSVNDHSGGNARLQLAWLNERGEQLSPEIQVIPCLPEAHVHSVELIAPRGACTALIRVAGHDSEPVVFDSISFRN